MNYYRHGPRRGGGYGGVTIGVPPLTPMIRIIMIVCGCVWVLQFLWFRLTGGAVLEAVFGIVPANTIRGWVWQPLTYMWLHDPRTIMHVGFNMLFLWLLGGDLERTWGSRSFLRYYLVCGVGAAPFIVIAGLLSGSATGFDPARIPTIGASGAVYGIVLAFGLVFAERTILFMMIFPMKARTFAIIMFVVALVSTIGNTPGNVSNIGHLGGIVVGYLYLKRAWRVRDFWRELRWKVRRRQFRVLPPDDDDRWVN